MFFLGSAAAIYGFFVLSYLSWCLPGCHSTVVVIEVAMTVGGLTALGGTITAVARLVQKKRAFPTALGALIGCVAITLVGAIAYLIGG
jgi:hypothetical protein